VQRVLSVSSSLGVETLQLLMLVMVVAPELNEETILMFHKAV